MTYELCQELKNAGFPQGEWRGNGSFLSDVGIPKEIFVQEFSNEVAYVPTLSELIRECGDNFGDLYSTTNGFGCHRTGVREPVAYGDTPEEAVARLYIVLNGNRAA